MTDEKAQVPLNLLPVWLDSTGNCRPGQLVGLICKELLIYDLHHISAAERNNIPGF